MAIDTCPPSFHTPATSVRPSRLKSPGSHTALLIQPPVLTAQWAALKPLPVDCLTVSVT